MPITVQQRLIKALLANRPDVKKKTSRVSLEQAARELVKSMNLEWKGWKDVTSFRDQDAGRKIYEYKGEPF